jgi:hypothetical protein
MFDGLRSTNQVASNPARPRTVEKRKPEANQFCEAFQYKSERAQYICLVSFRRRHHG